MVFYISIDDVKPGRITSQETQAHFTSELRRVDFTSPQMGETKRLCRSGLTPAQLQRATILPRRSQDNVNVFVMTNSFLHQSGMASFYINGWMRVLTSTLDEFYIKRWE